MSLWRWTVTIMAMLMLDAVGAAAGADGDVTCPMILLSLSVTKMIWRKTEFTVSKWIDNDAQHGNSMQRHTQNDTKTTNGRGQKEWRRFVIFCVLSSVASNYIISVDPFGFLPSLFSLSVFLCSLVSSRLTVASARFHCLHLNLITILRLVSAHCCTFDRKTSSVLVDGISFLFIPS